MSKPKSSHPAQLLAGRVARPAIFWLAAVVAVILVIVFVVNGTATAGDRQDGAASATPVASPSVSLVSMSLTSCENEDQITTRLPDVFTCTEDAAGALVWMDQSMHDQVIAVRAAAAAELKAAEEAAKKAAAEKKAKAAAAKKKAAAEKKARAAAAKQAAAEKKAAAEQAAAEQAAAEQAAEQQRMAKEAAQQQAPAAPSAYYPNCAAARAAGAAPVYAGGPGYSRQLDRDGDGVGCE